MVVCTCRYGTGCAKRCTVAAPVNFHGCAVCINFYAHSAARGVDCRGCYLCSDYRRARFAFR